MKLKHSLLLAACATALTGGPATAGVSATEAARLKTDLTPLGAERAGNKDGTIPAWTGGLSNIPGWSPGKRRTDPFKDEKPLFSISAKNLDQYADKLNDGTRAMLKRYPETFRLDVYKTHRTAMAPQAVYDATAKNAVNGRVENGLPVNVAGGIPFPLPANAQEVMFNHLLRWRGVASKLQQHGVQVTADGKLVMTVAGALDQQYPYYAKPESHGGEYWLIRLLNLGPPVRAGEAIVGRENIDPEKTGSWVYLTGQRRVRKLPNACCDTPTPATAGLMSFDEVGVWTGRIDRFDWKLIGKQEMFIPYNANRTFQPTKDGDLLGPRHVNPDHLRWELHRVWVVEATLRQGQRHLISKARYYLDEDTWNATLGDRWDARGQLWKTLWGASYVAPDMPGVPLGVNGFYDFTSGAYFVNDLPNEFEDAVHFVAPQKDAIFTPESMAADGVR